MKVPTTNWRIRGFTVADLLVLLVALGLVFCLLPAMLLRKGSVQTKRAACVSNLKSIGLGFRIWANDHEGAFPMQVSTNQGGSREHAPASGAFHHFKPLSNQFVNPKILACPADRERKPARDFAGLSDQRLSYFVGLEASGANGAMFLSGDRNLNTNGIPVMSGELKLTTNHVAGWTNRPHGRLGNILLADGTVQGTTVSGLQKLLETTGVHTNRLAIP